METRSDPISTPADSASLTAARAHVQSLSSSDREVLLRALLEPVELRLAEQQPEHSKPDSPTAAQEQSDDPTRLSVSTTASAASSTSSTGDASLVSALSTPPLPSSSDSPAEITAALTQYRPTSHASTAPSTRAYWCLSCGKKQSSRSEWKQHDSEHHHHHHHHHRPRPRRRSGSPAGHRRRAWGCGFCAAFLGSQDRFQDHVALHFEAGKTLAHWHHENVIYGLLHQPAVHEAWKALQAARYAALPRAQRPKMGWDAAVTGRGDGQLQSLLEYFDASRHSAWDVARLADDLAIRITLSVVATTDESGDPAAGSAIPRLSISAAAAAGATHRQSKWASAAPQQQQPQQHIASALVPEPLKPAVSARIVSRSSPPVAERRPLPQLAVENYYDPHPGTRVQIPDFLPVASEHHPSAVQPTPRHLFGDWDSLASTVVETPRNFSLPCPRHWASTQFLPSGAVA